MIDRSRTKQQLEELTEVLFAEWDPIGINDGRTAPRDEYAQQAMRLLPQLRAGATPKELAPLLREIARDEMGLRMKRRDNVTAAKRICQWFDSQAQQGDVDSPEGT